MIRHDRPFARRHCVLARMLQMSSCWCLGISLRVLMQFRSFHVSFVSVKSSCQSQSVRLTMVSMKVVTKGMPAAMKVMKAQRGDVAQAQEADDKKSVPTAFAAKTSAKANPLGRLDTLDMTDQKQRDAMNKRAASSFKWGIKSAPPKRLEEYQKIMDLTGPDKTTKLREFRAKFLANKDWNDSSFEEKVTNSWEETNTLNKDWVSFGRLQKLIGKHEANLAVKNEWYNMRPGPKPGQLEIEYKVESVKTEDKFRHDLSIDKTDNVEGDAAAEALSKLVARGALPTQKAVGGRQRALENIASTQSSSSGAKKRPAAAETPLPGEPAPAPKKGNTATAKHSMAAQCAATDDAIKVAYTKMTTQKAELTKGKSRLASVVPTTDRLKRSMSNCSCAPSIH